MTSVVAVWIFGVVLLGLWAGALAIAERAVAMSAPDAWPLHERILLAGANAVMRHGPVATVVGPSLVAIAGALRHRRGLPLATERRLLLAWLSTAVAASAASLTAASPSVFSALVITLANSVELAAVAACAAVAAHLQRRLPSPHASRRAWIVAIATLLLAAGPIELLWVIPPALVWWTSGHVQPSG